MFELTSDLLEGLPKNGPTDPIEYYRRPLVGGLFRRRINLGLSMLGDARFGRAMEVGYAAGAVQLALASGVDELHGLDLDADVESVSRLLASRGISAELKQGSVYELPYPAQSMDLVVCFSVFEHLAEYKTALAEVHRVLKTGGLFLLGMPAVNKMMEAGFYFLGFKGIEDHHITTPAQVEAEFRATGYSVVAEKHLYFPFASPVSPRLYNNWLLRRV